MKTSVVKQSQIIRAFNTKNANGDVLSIGEDIVTVIDGSLFVAQVDQQENPQVILDAFAAAFGIASTAANQVANNGGAQFFGSLSAGINGVRLD